MQPVASATPAQHDPHRESSAGRIRAGDPCHLGDRRVFGYCAVTSRQPGSNGTVNLLFVSDLHYALKQFDWLAEAAPHVDVLIIGGDLLDVAGAVDLPVQIAVILKYLERFRAHTRVVVSSGNHDLDSRNPAGEKVARWILKARRLGVATDGDARWLGDTRITVCPWWDGPDTRAEVGELLARHCMEKKRRWIWIYHAPPDQSPTSWVGKRHIGDEALSAWITDYRPDIVMTGHIHQSPFARDGSWVDQIGSTWVVNPGRQIGPVPTRILFDMADGTATWLSLAGAEKVRLDAELVRPVADATEVPDWIR